MFTRRGFDEWKDQLVELRIDRLARRARFIDRLLARARSALPEIAAARSEYNDRHTAAAKREAAAREAEFQRCVAEENPRRLKQNDVVALLKEAGHHGPWYGPISAAFHAAYEAGVITDVEFTLASRDYGRDFDFYD